MSSPSRPGPQGIGLASTHHTELAPFVPLPSLPANCGAADPELRLFDEPRSLNRDEVLAQAGTVAQLLGNTDVSYLCLKDNANTPSCSLQQRVDLYDEVLRCNSQAFECTKPGLPKKQINSTVCERKSFDQNVRVSSGTVRDYGGRHSEQFDGVLPNDEFTSPPEIAKVRNSGLTLTGSHSSGLQDATVSNSTGEDIRRSDNVLVDEAFTSSSKKVKVKKKGTTGISFSELQDAAINGFCEMLENFCGQVEIPADDRDDMEWLSLSDAEVRKVVNEVMSIRGKKVLHLVPVDILIRVLKVLDHQIHLAEGLSVDECQHLDSDMISSIFCALESIHAALAIMAHNGMPKQIYKEEAIERILEFSRHQIIDVMLACDPSYRALHKPQENSVVDGDEEEEVDDDYGSASKRRRTSRGAKVKKTTSNKASAAVNAINQKLCTILAFLKELLLIERLSDSCILQLTKTCFTTFLVDNIQLLQLKAISLISAVFFSYREHRTYVLDEILQLLWKLPSSKRVLRTYHLPDEEEKQIQMVSALLIHMVQFSANLPESLRQTSNGNPIFEVSIDASYLTKCHGAVTETCCLFWSHVLQRFASVKSQDASELKVTIENLVMDLLATLNLPEYPASAPILEVLCVLLLQNAGPKSKDLSARSMAIDILGTIAARLKHNGVVCSRDKFWIAMELVAGNAVDCIYPKDACSICLNARVESPLFVCKGCKRLFHAECMGVTENEVPISGWYCQICQCRKQLAFLQAYCKTKYKDNEQASEASDLITNVEIVQQMLLNYLQDSGSADDMHLFTRWFYLCLWCKDDSNAHQKLIYHLARLKSKAIARDSGTVSSLLTRTSIKKIALALGQNNSFSRGLDKIVSVLLGSLRENSPVIRAKALRAVSIIVEADPEVLREKHVQLAVEGRFCDSAISVREAALELVGRHIASHPDVGLQYFEKVAERIKDTGVSVRKRAIKIIRDMCTSNANFCAFNDACVEILSRVADDEASIQDLVCKTFYEFWFEEPPGSQTQYFRDGSSVPLEVAKKSEQIVEMLRRMPSHQLLVDVIRRNLALDFLPQAAKAAGINPISLAQVRKRCELMCKCLLERILQVEEMITEKLEEHALPYVLALHAFCVVDPTLCAPASDPSQFVVTLQPYLKSQVDNRLVANLLESIIFVIDAVLPLLRKLPQNVVEELEQDLKHMIVRHPFLTVVHSCIKCLCSVSKLAGKGSSVIEHLVQAFYKRLDALGLKNQQQVARSLFCIGLLIRYGNSLLHPSSPSNKYLDVASSLRVFIKYLSMEDFGIKLRSLQALGFVLIAKPQYMLENNIVNILEAMLSSDSDCRLKIQALQNLHEYLLDAESQMAADKTTDDGVQYSSNGGHAIPIAAGAGDTNLCGGIIQLYWNSVLGRCLDSNEQVRQSALKIVEVVFRQGLVHPITCVPYLIALETDPWELNSTFAHRLLMNMNEKYPAFFESRLGDGLQMSFIFIHSIGNSSSEYTNSKIQPKVLEKMKGKLDGSSSFARLGVSRIYKLIRSNRVSRNKFMYSVVRKFDSPSYSDSIIPFLMYCTELLALLPFTSLDEPLYLVHAINRVSQVRAGPLEADMKALSVQFLEGKSQENAIIQNGVEQVGPTYQPVTSGQSDLDSMGSGASCNISKDDLQRIQMDSLAATALELLLKLKRHLKTVYSLNDSRCQAYTPNEPIKAGEVFSRQNISFSARDTRVDLPTTSQEFIQRYQEFKSALKEDTVDYTVYTANIRKQRPSRRGRPGRKVSGDVYEDDDMDDADYDSDEDRTANRRLSSSGRKRRQR